MTEELDHLHEQVPGDYYDTAIATNIFQRFWHTRRFINVTRFLKKNSAKKILDVGCHGGRFTAEIERVFPYAQICGIDMSQQAIAFAKTHHPRIKFHVARAEKLPFGNEKFDLVTCFEMLEHVEDPGKVIEEIYRVMTPGGRIIALVPSENTLFQIIWYLWTHLGPGRVWHHTHVQKFTATTLDTLLEEFGCTISRRKVFLLGMLLLIEAVKPAQSKISKQERRR